LQTFPVSYRKDRATFFICHGIKDLLSIKKRERGGSVSIKREREEGL
jgi:hypothetical protein